MAKSREIRPAEDYGFFGPDSVTWKVWGYPTSAVVGISRAVVIEELDPPLIAAVDKTGANYDRPRTRYERTVRYFAAVAFGDSRTVSQMADVLVKVHSKAIGIEPISGGKYDANDPKSQLWILLTGWHSVLKAYELYGPGKLTEAEENRFWEECAIAAEFQTCDPADVPRTREGIREYFEQMRPHLAASEAAQKMMAHLLDPGVALPPMRGPRRLGMTVVNRVIRAGTVATMPHWMRKMGGFPQSTVVDVAVRPILRLGLGVLDHSTFAKRYVVSVIAPSTLPLVEPVWHGIPPVHSEVLGPQEARRRYGFEAPAQAHLDIRAKQYDRVFGRGDAPSEDGIVESQALLGSIS
jgi:uncharacterized protein (DUF2236 family)